LSIGKQCWNCRSTSGWWSFGCSWSCGMMIT